MEPDWDQAMTAEQAMEQELEELILAAKRRPITDDEAAILFFHVGLPNVKEHRL